MYAPVKWCVCACASVCGQCAVTSCGLWKNVKGSGLRFPGVAMNNRQGDRVLLVMFAWLVDDHIFAS